MAGSAMADARFVAERFVTAALLAAIVAVSAGDAEAKASPPPPSVLLITLDTTRADHLGAYGAPFAVTPNLDALAASGVRFEHALSPTPLTLPSHATLLTGLVPRRHGIRDNSGFPLADGVVSVAQRFQAAGYRTAAFVSAAVLDRAAGLDLGFDRYDDAVRIGEAGAFGYVERAASQTVDAALGDLPSQQPPFFLWVHLFDPHLPYVPPEPWRTRMRDRPYDGEIAFMDQQIGRLLDAVRRRAPRLVVAVAGDHGESLGEHGEAGHGIFLYDATQRVPLLLAGPGVPAATVVGEPVGLVDLAPTLLDLAGLAPVEDVDGTSLVAAWKGGNPTDVAYEMETFYPRFAFGWAPLRALSRGPWKWIDAPRPELYRRDRDPGETRDLASGEPAIARDLRGQLFGLVGDDDPSPPDGDAVPEERRRRLESLGYVSGGTGSPTGPDPKDAVDWLGDLDAGRRAFQEGRPKDGIAPLERLLRRNPENLQARLALGLCRFRSDDLAGAEREFRAAVERAPDRAVPWLRLGDALAARAVEDPSAGKEARVAYEKALTLHPRDADAYRGLLLLSARAEDGAAIDRLADRALREDFRDPVFDTEMGLLALARGQPARAEASLRRAVEADPRASRALEGLGRIAYARGDARDAERWYVLALEAGPSVSLAKSLGAIRLHALGDRRGALDAFREAVALARPGDPDLPELRALVQELSAPL